MRLLHELMSQPYFAEPEAFRAAIELLANREVGETIKALATKPGEKVANHTTLRDGVAVISVFGPIFRHANLMTDLCESGVSTARLATELQAAAENPAVRSIVLNVDSPGGEANGISELAATIRGVTKIKPVVAYVGGSACSAAYYLASAADEIVVSSMAMLGSIGTVIGYRDTSARDERLGIKNVEIVSSQSPRKRPDMATDEGRAEIQARADDLTQVFATEVAQYRGVPLSKVLSDFGQGGILVGEKAVKAGLADRLGSFEGLLQELNGSRWDRARGQTSRSGGLKVAASVPTPQREQRKMDVVAYVKGLLAANPDQRAELSAVLGDEPVAASVGIPVQAVVSTQEAKDDPKVTALLQQVASLQAANAASQARETLSSLRDRLTPAQSSLLQPFLVQCAADDLSSPLQQGSRVEALRAALAAGVQHGATTSQLQDDGTLKTLDNHVEPKAADAAPTQERIDSLLSQTEKGRAILAARQK